MASRPHPAGVPYVEYDEVEAACPECGAVFRSTEALDAHLRESHAGTGSARGAPPKPKAVKCSVCGAKFPSISALQRHNKSAHVT
jgi:uncharacterized C2H2 Zn-finger protein